MRFAAVGFEQFLEVVQGAAGEADHLLAVEHGALGGQPGQCGHLGGHRLPQAVPGPLFTFAAWLGAVMGPAPNGVAGAAIALVSLFLPGFLILIGALPFWDRLRRTTWAQSAMQGANAAVVGILGAVAAGVFYYFLRGTGSRAPLMTLPLLAGGVCILTSILGTYFVKLGSSKNIMGALYKGFVVSALASIPALWLATKLVFPDMSATLGTANGVAFTGWDLFHSMLVGLAVTGLMVWITEYYTGTNYRPVRSIAKASETGHGTNVIQGLAISLESTALPTVVICVGIIVSYQLAGLIGIAFAALAGLMFYIALSAPATAALTG